MDAATLQALRLLPGGRLIFSNVDPETESADLWEVQLNPTDGSRRGEPHRLTNWGGSQVLSDFSTTLNGKSLFFLKTSLTWGTFIADFDQNNLKLGESRLLTSTESVAVPMDWTTDGKAVLFMSRQNGHVSIRRQDLNADNPITIVQGAKDAECQDPHLSSDGAWVVYFLSPREGETGRMMRVSVHGGQPEPIAISSELLYQGIRCAGPQGGFCAFAERSSDAKEIAFIAFDPLKGRGRELVRTSVDPAKKYDWLLSPDGSYIVTAQENAEEELNLLSTKGAPLRKISIRGWPNLSGMVFSADSKGLFMVGASNGVTTLLYVDLTGKVSPLWHPKSPLVEWAIPSRDGKRLAILGQSLNSNVWSIREF